MNGCHDTIPSCVFRLIIDGCNGPIRFRKSLLERATNEGVASPSHESGADNNHSSRFREKSDGVDDDEGTILSFLRPESIVLATPTNRSCNKTKSKKKKKTSGRNTKKKNKPATCIAEDVKCVEETTNRLDMIPHLEKLLSSSVLRESETGDLKMNIFESVSVLFDGVSITKRPSAPASNKKDSQERENCYEAIDEEIIRGRFWHVTSDRAAASTTAFASEAGLCDIVDKSGRVAIEVTGLYDEADNVIVERIQEYHRRNVEIQSSTQQQPNNPAEKGQEGGRLTATTRIHVLRRTERGPGKNRRLFQPIGLLRPESVACVFEFAAPMTPHRLDSDASDEKSGCGDERGDFLECQHQARSDASPDIGRLAHDGNQILRSVRRHNPGNVFLALDEPMKVFHPACADHAVPLTIPIVATDDVFLRQRIVHEGGYVMTFHQLWLMLMDAASS